MAGGSRVDVPDPEEQEEYIDVADMERLQLSSYETFFLAGMLGVLQVVDEEVRPQWRECMCDPRYRPFPSVFTGQPSVSGASLCAPHGVCPTVLCTLRFAILNDVRATP
jgi:hypothetical protein